MRFVSLGRGLVDPPDDLSPLKREQAGRGRLAACAVANVLAQWQRTAARRLWIDLKVRALVVVAQQPAHERRVDVAILLLQQQRGKARIGSRYACV